MTSMQEEKKNLHITGSSLKLKATDLCQDVCLIKILAALRRCLRQINFNEEAYSMRTLFLLKAGLTFLSCTNRKQSQSVLVIHSQTAFC